MDIVGTGLSGLIAAHIWPNANVFELSPSPIEQHKALLRFRSDVVSQVTGIEFKRVKVRKGRINSTPPGSDFSSVGPEIRPAVLSASLGQVDANGFSSKGGYLFMIFLPDSSLTALWVHERNTGTSMLPVPDVTSTGQTGGGSGKIGTDNAETNWNCYAIPATLGTSGNRCFFASQSGDLLQSQNEVARHTGATNPVDGRSAFLGDGITSLVAVGTKGRDDDVWKVTN